VTTQSAAPGSQLTKSPAGATAPVSGAGLGSVESVNSDHISLLHNQLLFERHRQDMHARRNRRLLGRSVKVVSLEEQNVAMVVLYK